MVKLKVDLVGVQFKIKTAMECKWLLSNSVKAICLSQHKLSSVYPPPAHCIKTKKKTVSEVLNKEKKTLMFYFFIVSRLIIFNIIISSITMVLNWKWYNLMYNICCIWSIYGHKKKKNKKFWVLFLFSFYFAVDLSEVISYRSRFRLII